MCYRQGAVGRIRRSMHIFLCNTLNHRCATERRHDGVFIPFELRTIQTEWRLRKGLVNFLVECVAVLLRPIRNFIIDFETETSSLAVREWGLFGMHCGDDIKQISMTWPTVFWRIFCLSCHIGVTIPVYWLTEHLRLYVRIGVSMNMWAWHIG